MQGRTIRRKIKEMVLGNPLQEFWGSPLPNISLLEKLNSREMVLGKFSHATVKI